MKTAYAKLSIVLILLLISTIAFAETSATGTTSVTTSSSGTAVAVISSTSEVKCGVNSFSVYDECSMDSSADSNVLVNITADTADSSAIVSTTNIATSESEIGYRYAKWSCYDGTASDEGGETSCKSSSTWKDYATRDCENKCSSIPNVKESVKCVFRNTETKQECYDSSGKYSCSTSTVSSTGESTCLIDGISGTKGTMLTWKSSCGEYAYTTIDGENEYAKFDCGQGNSYPTLDLHQIKAEGYYVSQNGVTFPVCGELDETWCLEENPNAEGDGAIEFQWGDGLVTCGWFAGEHTYQREGKYRIEVRSKNTCGFVSSRDAFVSVPDNGETICEDIYSPVCGSLAVACIRAPCDPIKVTYSNKCELEKAGAKYISSGKCEDGSTDTCACTMEYAPVCAVRTTCESNCYVDVEETTQETSTSEIVITAEGNYTVKTATGATISMCESSCYEQKQTYSNECSARCDGAKVVYNGECGNPVECEKQDYEQVRQLKDRCYASDGRIIEKEDEQGCEQYHCILPTDEQECTTQEDIVEKVASCENEGGKFYGRFDEQGCLVTAECVREGQQDQNYEVTEVPDASRLLEIALKLEDLKMEFGKLKAKIAGIAEYYRNEGDTNTADKFDVVVEIITAAQEDVEIIKDMISQNIDNFDLEMVREVKEAIRKIKEERIKEIVKAILSS